MAIRFSHRELWERDWFLNMEGKYQLFVLYLRDHCDHAGIWQPSFKRFEMTSGFRVNPEDFIKSANRDQQRICLLENGKWWLSGFIEDQYKTKVLKGNINAHKGVINSLHFNQAPYESMGYKLGDSDPSLAPKDKDKDKDKDKNSSLSFPEEDSKGETVNPEYRACSELLMIRILEIRQAKITEATLKNWDNTVRLMVKRDNRKIEDIKALINECHDMEPNANGFTWRTNILSMSKLRERWNEGQVGIGMNNKKIIQPVSKPLVPFQKAPWEGQVEPGINHDA